MYIRNIVRHWVPFAVVSTLFCGLIYATVQQNIRSSANDPQIQIAETIGNALVGGQAPQAVIPDSRVDIATSLANYAILYDDAGKPVIASGQLHGNVPTLPPGIFEYVRAHGEDRITWQPEPDVRSAIVVIRFVGPKKSGFILVGRSLREIEKREDRLVKMIALAWAATLGITLVVSTAVVLTDKRSHKPNNLPEETQQT